MSARRERILRHPPQAIGRGKVAAAVREPREEPGLDRPTLGIGPAPLRIGQRIGRCAARAAKPETGCRAAAAPGAPEAGRRHADVGVPARGLGRAAAPRGDRRAPA